MVSGCLSVCASVVVREHLSRDATGWMSLKLGTNIHHVSGNC